MQTKMPWWTRAGYPVRVEFEPEVDYSILERTKARRLLTVQEAVTVADRAERTLHDLLERGTIPGVKRGKQWYLAFETAAWLREQPKTRRNLNRVATDRYHRKEAILNLASEKG